MPTKRSEPLRRHFLEWSRTDRSAGVTLAIATLAALAWANADGDGYRHVWATVLSGLELTGLHLSARAWVNEGLMTFFFVVVGLEIRRETVAGELASWRRASRPMVAAISGMAVPALVYVAFVHDGPGGHGWGIPMATDVAFSLGALALVGSRVSLRLRVFLMTLAIADDILSIVVLVAVYSADLDAAFVAAGGVCLLAMAGARAVGRVPDVVPVVLGAAAWWLWARGGIEAAIVGAAVGMVGLAAVMEHGAHDGPRHWERRLIPIVNLGVLPLFAVANAGVDVSRLDLGSAPALRVFLAVLVARVVGKPLGIWLVARVGHGRERLGIGAAASVGFTVPLLIVRAAFGEGVLADSATAALLAATVLGLMTTFAFLARPRS
jgi:NhaA family Na+:H+ antiporter